MRILYAETTAYAPSSAHFLEALEASMARGEHEFRFLDEAGFIKSSRSLAERIADRVAGRPLSGRPTTRSAIRSAIERERLMKSASSRNRNS